MEMIKKYAGILMMLTLLVGFTSCEDDEDIYDDLIGRTWLDLNSSYAHSSLALPALHAQIANNTDIEWCTVSATINENTGSEVVMLLRVKRCAGVARD